MWGGEARKAGRRYWIDRQGAVPAFRRARWLGGSAMPISNGVSRRLNPLSAWVGRLTVSLRLLLGIVVPLVALVASLAIFYVVRGSVEAANDAGGQTVSRLLDAKEVRDSLSALQLSMNMFVGHPDGSA